MVCNSPCSVCFLTSKPFRPGGIDLFVVCLVSIGCSLLCYKFPPNFFRTNSKNKLHKTNFCFDHFLVFLLFYSIVFYSKRDFLIALTLCSRPNFPGCFSKIQNVGCQKISQDNLIIFVVSSTESVDSLKALGKG